MKPSAIKNDDMKQSHFHMPNQHEQAMHMRSAQDRQALQFEALCFKVFHTTEDGKDLARLIKDNLLITPMTDPSHPQAANLAMFEMGFKEAMRGLLAHGDAHQRRINEGNNGS